MSNPAAKYTDEFRRETADYIISTGRPITECRAELGLNSKTVNKWVQNRRRELSGGPDPKAEDRELREARRRIRELEMENAEFPVKMMARVLGVSRSGFYSWLSNGCPREDWSAEREAVRRVWLESDRRFGFRFVKCFLPGEFSGLTLYRVRKLMRELGIRGCTPNARKRTTIPDPKARPRPDLVRRDFTSPVPTYKLVGDITYLRTGEGWLYLSTVIDLNTRMVVGWSLSERMTADIAVAALTSAKSRGYVAGNAIFHADRGAQRRAAVLQPHRQLPRQRGGRVVLRHAEERDVLQAKLPDQGFRQARGGRVHRGVLQPPKAPLDDRLQGAGRGHGGLLRENRAQARGHAYGRLIPRACVSEILTQVTPRRSRGRFGCGRASSRPCSSRAS